MNDRLRANLLTTVHATREIEALLVGGVFAADLVGSTVLEGIFDHQSDEQLLRFQRVFVRRMLSRYLGRQEASAERYATATVLLPFIDYVHALWPIADSNNEFEALDRQWLLECEWRESSRAGDPMMEAMITYSLARTAIGIDSAKAPLPYSVFPFASFEAFLAKAGSSLSADWNPFNVLATMRALNQGEEYMRAELDRTRARSDPGAEGAAP